MLNTSFGGSDVGDDNGDNCETGGCGESSDCRNSLDCGESRNCWEFGDCGERGGGEPGDGAEPDSKFSKAGMLPKEDQLWRLKIFI